MDIYICVCVVVTTPKESYHICQLSIVWYSTQIEYDYNISYRSKHLSDSLYLIFKASCDQQIFLKYGQTSNIRLT